MIQPARAAMPDSSKQRFASIRLTNRKKAYCSRIDWSHQVELGRRLLRSCGVARNFHIRWDHSNPKSELE